ncbi:MAG: CGNR zinc finger domain-containing protein [Solirubrobacteraceae bacterium]
MTGETVQPGGRAPAPGVLALVQAFVNSHDDLTYDRGADLLATPADVQRWLVGHRLIAGEVSVDESDRALVVATREALRSLARDDGDHAAERLNAAAEGAGVEVRFGPRGPEFVSHDDDVRGALGLLLALVARAMLDGTWHRLKVCPGEDCGWMFFDTSRNQSGRWCSMSVCGGREKAKAHYRRKRAHS